MTMEAFSSSALEANEGGGGVGGTLNESGGRRLTRGVPFDGIDLVAVPLKDLERLRLPQLAHVDHLVCAACRKGRVVAPVHVQRRR